MEPEELERSPLFVDRIIATDEAMSAVRGVAGISLTAINITCTQGAAFSGAVATFTDSTSGVSAGDYLATIYWGDGNQSSGVVSNSSGTFSVSGTNHAATGS